MKRPAIFFDRDNTLIISSEYLGDPGKVVLIRGAADAIARGRSMGFVTVVVSNQSGVARGLFSEDAVHAVNRRLDQLLLATNQSAIIDRHEFCPFHPDASIEKYRLDSDLRKPKPGMLLYAADKLALDLTRSWMIGDAPRDVKAGHAAGCRTILLQIPDIAKSVAADETCDPPADFVASSFQEAMDHIEAATNADHAAEESDEPAEPVMRIEPTEEPTMPPISEDEPTDQGATEPIAAEPALGAPQIPVIEAVAPRMTTAYEQPAVVQTAAQPAPQKIDLSRLEHTAERIYDEIRKQNERSEYSDFSVSKLMAGVVQVLALAILLLSYLYRNQQGFEGMMLCAIFLQVFTIAMLIMGRQK